MAPCAYVFKTVADPYAGRLSVFRIYSGTVKSDSSFYNANKETSERFGQLFLPKAKTRNRWKVPGRGPLPPWPNSRKRSPGTPCATRPNP